MALLIIIIINKLIYYPFIKVAYIKSSSAAATKDLAENIKSAPPQMTKKGLHKLSASSSAKKHLADHMCHISDDEEGDGEHQHGRHQLLSDGFQTDPRYCGDLLFLIFFFFGGGGGVFAGLSTFYLDEDFHF